MRINRRILRMPDPAPPGPGTGGNPGVEDWRSSLPEDIRNEPSLAQVPDVPTLAKNYVHAQRQMGSRIPAPQPTWNEQQWEEHFARIGRPQDPAQYPEPPKENLPEGLEFSPEKMAEAKKMFHRAGLTPRQAETILGYYVDVMKNQVNHQRETEQNTVAQATVKLQEKHGDKFPQVLDKAKSVVRHFGDPEFQTFLQSTGMGNNPYFIEMLAKIGDRMLEDRAPGRGAGLAVEDATAAAAEITRLKTDPEFMKALGNRQHLGHKAAVDRWTVLHGRANPGAAQE